MKKQVQEASDSRNTVRKELFSMAGALRQELDLENSMVADVPEGTVVLELKISSTLARKWIRCLDRAVGMI